MSTLGESRVSADCDMALDVIRTYREQLLRSVMETPEDKARALYQYESSNISVNIAAGPNCPVRCEGCYNFFGDTRLFNNLITVDDITGFMQEAQPLGIAQVTLYGGDPLHHPQIIPIARGIKELGMRVKLDTVGTALLGEQVRVVYKGKGEVPYVNVEDIAPYVDHINIPLDGSDQTILNHFRKGRSHLFEETIAVAALLRRTGIPFGINTVANAANLTDLPKIKRIAQEVGACEWQVFEYDYEGPNSSTKRDVLRLEPGRFAAAAYDLQKDPGDIEIACKPFDGRAGSYFMIDDAGIAYRRRTGGGRDVIGHVTHERALVLEALGEHIVAKRSRARSKAIGTIRDAYGLGGYASLCSTASV